MGRTILAANEHGNATGRLIRVGGPILLLLSAAVGPVRAQQEEPLPSVEEILQKYLEVIGGRAALERIKNRVSSGTIEVPVWGWRGTVTVREAAPDKLYEVVQIFDVGKSERGTNGQTYWRTGYPTGPQLVEGEEKAAMVLQATFNALLHWRKLYPKAECVGIDTTEGQPAYKLVMTPAEGPAETWYLDQEKYLRTRIETTIKTESGKVAVATLFSDFKKVDGILLPHKSVLRMAGMQQTITLKRIDHNVEVPKDQFDPPEDVQELLDRKSGTQPTTRAATRPTTKPTARLATRPATRPTTRPTTQPTTRPTTPPIRPTRP